MLARQVVLLTHSESSGPTQLLSRQHLVRVSPLAATLMNLLASVANKRLAAGLSPLDSALTKNTGEGSPPFDVPKFGRLDAETLRRSLLSLFAPRVFHNSFAIKRFHTLSQKCRVSPLREHLFLKYYFNSSASSSLFSSSPFNGLHTLPVPYSVNPLLGTLTKTAGCIPTIPILKLTASPPRSFSLYVLTSSLRLLSRCPLPTTHSLQVP